jgi:hypothetical protein
MLSNSGAVSLGSFTVQSTSGRGFTAEELAARAVEKIVSISDKADPIVQAQAHAFKARVEAVILFYLKQAIASEHTTLYNRFVAAGHPELAVLLKEQ